MVKMFNYIVVKWQLLVWLRSLSIVHVGPTSEINIRICIWCVEHNSSGVSLVANQVQCKVYRTTHKSFQMLMPFLHCYHFHNLLQGKTVGICSIVELGRASECIWEHLIWKLYGLHCIARWYMQWLSHLPTVLKVPSTPGWGAQNYTRDLHQQTQQACQLHVT